MRNPVSVVVIVHNCADLVSSLWSTVSELLATPVVKSAVFVDNNSTDGSRSRLRSLAETCQELNFIELPANVGFGRAAEVGIQASRDNSDILLLNPDCKIEARTVLQLHSALQRREWLGVIAPEVLVQPDGIVTARQQFRSFRSELCRLTSSATPPPRSGSGEVDLADWVLGACVLISADFLNAIGGYPTHNFLYGEELWLSWLARKHGYSTAVLLDSSAEHVGGYSTKKAWTSSEIGLRKVLAELEFYEQTVGLTETKLVSLVRLARWFVQPPTSGEDLARRHGLAVYLFGGMSALQLRASRIGPKGSIVSRRGTPA